MSKTFFKDYGFAIIFTVVFLLTFIAMGSKRTILSNQNDVTDWLPNTFRETKEYAWFLEHFPYEKFLIIGWEGSTLKDDRVEMLAQKLVPGQTIDNFSNYGQMPQYMAELVFPDQPGSSPANPDSPAPAAENHAAEGGAGSTGELEPPESKGYYKFVMTGPRLLQFMKERFPDLPEETILKRLDGLLIGPGKTEGGEIIPTEERNTAMLVTIDPALRGKELNDVIAEVHRLAVECGIEDSPLPDTRTIPQKLIDNFSGMIREIVYGRDTSTNGAVIGGPPVDNAAIGAEGERTLYRLAGLCALFGLVLSLLCFRDLRLTMFVFWVSLLAAGVSLSMVWVLGQKCDTILLSMPALIYILAMSGSIHIINYYHDEIRTEGLDGAPERAIKVAWYPCFMAAFTTSLGLGSLYMSHLIPIQKFGFFSALGVMLALLLMFLYLPSMLNFYPSRKFAQKYAGMGHQSDDGMITKFWQTVGGFVVRNNKPVALICLALMIFFAYGMSRIEVSIKMMRFFTKDSEIVTHYIWLEKKLGPLVPMELVIVFENDECLADKDGKEILIDALDRIRLIDTVGDALRLELHREVGGVMSAATFGPKLDSASKRGIKTQLTEYGIAGRLDANRETLKDYVSYDGNPSFKLDNSKLPQVLESLLTTEDAVDPRVLRLRGVNRTEEDLKIVLDEIGFTREDANTLTRAGIDDLASLLRTPQGRTYQGIEAEQLEKYRLAGRDWQKKHADDLWRVSLRIWALQREFQSADASGTEVVDIAYEKFVQSVQDVVEPVLEKFRAEHNLTENSVRAVYTGMVPVVYKTQSELFTGLVNSLAMSFVLIAVVMMFILKNPIAGLIAMLPNLLPVVFTFGFMGHAGILVDLGAMMTASVALGIAVDNTIHYLTWFREGLDEGREPKAAAMMAYERCGTAMTQTMLIGGLGLSAFMFSTFTPTQMFGVMMLAILSVSLIGDLIFLPAILTGPAGRFFVGKGRKKNR